MPYNVEKYQYDSTEDFVAEGHSFVLVPAPADHEHLFLAGEIPKKSKHYVKYNIGAIFTGMDLSEIWSGKIKLSFAEGDFCSANRADNAQRYRSTVILQCDKSVSSQGVLTFSNETDGIFCAHFHNIQKIF